jgi:hypothetical protein
MPDFTGTFEKLSEIWKHGSSGILPIFFWLEVLNSNPSTAKKKKKKKLSGP